MKPVVSAMHAWSWYVPPSKIPIPCRHHPRERFPPTHANVELCILAPSSPSSQSLFSASLPFYSEAVTKSSSVVSKTPALQRARLSPEPSSQQSSSTRYAIYTYALQRSHQGSSSTISNNITRPSLSFAGFKDCSMCERTEEAQSPCKTSVVTGHWRRRFQVN